MRQDEVAKSQSEWKERTDNWRNQDAEAGRLHAVPADHAVHQVSGSSPCSSPGNGVHQPTPTQKALVLGLGLRRRSTRPQPPISTQPPTYL